MHWTNLNKASKSDLRKLSSFFAKTRKKAANSLRQFLAALEGYEKYHNHSIANALCELPSC